MIRVLLADDQALVRAGLQVLAGSAPDIEIVGEAADGRPRSIWPVRCGPRQC